MVCTLYLVYKVIDLRFTNAPLLGSHFTTRHSLLKAKCIESYCDPTLVDLFTNCKTLYELSIARNLL